MPKKILVVDDEASMRLLIETRLRASGYEVITACDGKSALSKTVEETPDLIILDVMMPPPDGFEVCWKLKGDPHYEHIPILMLTARSQDKDKTEGIMGGADAYLTKPFVPETLLERVRMLLGA